MKQQQTARSIVKFEFTNDEVNVTIGFLNALLKQNPHLVQTPEGKYIVSFLRKLMDSIDQEIQKPKGVTDKEFEEVCKACEAFNGTKCENTVAQKYPGKCDPVLIYRKNFEKGN